MVLEDPVYLAGPSVNHIDRIIDNFTLSEKLQLKDYTKTFSTFKEWKQRVKEEIEKYGRVLTQKETHSNYYLFESLNKFLVRKQIARYKYINDKFVVNKRYETKLIVDKVKSTHYIFGNYKANNRYKTVLRKFSINTIHNMQMSDVPQRFLDTVIPYIEKDGIFLKNIPRWICSVTELKKKKYTSLEDIWKKKFSFVRKKVFIQQIESCHFVTLWVIIQNKYSDNKTIELLKDQMKDPIKKDTIDFAFKLRKPYKVTWSDKRILDVHNNYAREITGNNSMNIKPIILSTAWKDFDKWFKKFELYNKYKFKLINEIMELTTLGTEEGHCVGSYGHRINQGSCAIYTCVFNDKRVTIEINKWSCPQSMYKYNQVCTSIRNLMNIVTSQYFIDKKGFNEPHPDHYIVIDPIQEAKIDHEILEPVLPF